jgi:hypothetical protein
MGMLSTFSSHPMGGLLCSRQSQPNPTLITRTGFTELKSRLVMTGGAEILWRKQKEDLEAGKRTPYFSTKPQLSILV